MHAFNEDIAIWVIYFYCLMKWLHFAGILNLTIKNNTTLQQYGTIIMLIQCGETSIQVY